MEIYQPRVPSLRSALISGIKSAWRYRKEIRQATISARRAYNNRPYRPVNRPSVKRSLTQALDQVADMPPRKKGKVMRKNKRNGIKRSRPAGRSRKFIRKSTRQVRKTRRSKTFRIKRPTVNSLFSSSQPMKVVDNNTAAFKSNTGLQGCAVFWNDPSTLDIQNCFALGFQVNSVAAAYNSSNNTAVAGNYGQTSKIALACTRTSTYRWNCNVPGTFKVYRCKARDDISSLNISPANPNASILSLLNASNVLQRAGTVNGNAINVYGVTPFDSTQFCHEFKIIKTTTKHVQPGEQWHHTYTTKPRIYTGYEANSQGILKGQIFDVYIWYGDLGTIQTGGTASIVNQVSFAPTEIAVHSKWTYSFVPELNPMTTVANKFLYNQVPNDVNAGAAAGASDNFVKTELDNTMVAAVAGQV